MDRGAAHQEAYHYWRQFTVNAHFTEPCVITGTVVNLSEHRLQTGVAPRVTIQQADGTKIVVLVTQARLLSAFVEAAPTVGDRVRITYHGPADKAAPGMSPAKQFTVEVRRRGDDQGDEAEAS